MENHFDQAAATWDLNEDRDRVHAKLAAALMTVAPEGCGLRALDFGCGTGAMSFVMSRRLDRVDAVDTSAGMIAKLSEKLIEKNAPTNIFPHRIELQKDSFPLGCFDLIYTVMALHHVKDIERIIGIFSRLLKPNGSLVLIDLAQEDGTFHADKTGIHHFGFEPQTIAGMLKQNDFSKTETSFPAARRRIKPDGSITEYPIFLISATKA